MRTFLILRQLAFSVILVVFTATGCSMYLPDLMSANPPEARISSETSIFSVIIMERGNRSWRSASLLKVTEKTRFSAASSLRSVIP